MGDPKRQRKKYETPSHPWRQENLEAELKLLGEYGLRNKREILIANSRLRRYRSLARSLFSAVGTKRAQAEATLLGKLHRLGILPEGATLDDVLKLSVRDFLERRLQTIVYKLGIARTPYQARQLITHGKIYLGERRVKSPGYHVLIGEEEKIRLVSA